MTVIFAEIPEWQTRTALLIGTDSLRRLTNARVLIVGLGGVGAYAAELLCRAGVGNLTVVDGDTIAASNRNRQLPALIETTGQAKAEVIAARLLQINPAAHITALNEFLRDERMRELLQEPFDYVVDAIDTLSPKAYLAATCLEQGLRLVSSMGAGGKLDPGQVRCADISETFNCALARAMRKRLHRMGISHGFKVVFSPEDINPDAVLKLSETDSPNQRSTVGTISYMPAVFGCFCASVVLRDLIADSRPLPEDSALGNVVRG